MKPMMLSLSALLCLTIGCNAEPTRAASRGPIDSAVGLLVPATSPEAHALGVSGWEIRFGTPGLQMTGLDAHGRRAGTALFALRSHAGVARSMLVVRLKMGARGQLALAADGTVVENTLAQVPASSRWLEAMSADLSSLDVGGLVPYDSTGECVIDAASTASTCVGAGAAAAACGPTFGISCGMAVAGAVFCARGITTTSDCFSPGGREAPGPDACTSGPEMGVACTTGSVGADPSGAPSESSDDPWSDTASAGGDPSSDPGADPSGDPGADPSGDPGADPSGDPGADPSDDWGDTGADGSTDDWGGSDSDSDGWEDDWGDTGADGSADDWSSDDSSWDDSSSYDDGSGYDDSSSYDDGSGYDI